MNEPRTTRFRRVLAEKLEGSLVELPAPGTTRQVRGPLQLPGKVTTVTGMRRTGKTTFVHQIRRVLHSTGTSLDRLPFVSFEDERLAQLEAEHLDTLVEELAGRPPSPTSQGRITWCFDEIQVVPHWERFVRRLVDSGDVDVIVTGSSADLLSREIATSLRGRAWNVPLFPFSFAEALDHQGLPTPPRSRAMPPSERQEIERALRQWLARGGFPEAQRHDNATRAQLLTDYVDVAILRDVVERHSVRNITGLRWLVRHLLCSPASLFSAQKFYAALKSQGIAISKDSVHEFIGYLEDCYLIRTVWMESSSERQRMVNPRKSYPIDSGLIPLFDRSGKQNLGHALETAVLIELERRRHSVTYVKTAKGYEVDFLARDPEGPSDLVQVCADASDPETARREFRALRNAGESYPEATQRLIVLDHAGLPAEVPEGVTVNTAIEWFCGSDR